MSYKQPSTGIPIAPRLTAAAVMPTSAGWVGQAGSGTLFEAAALPQLAEATPGGFGFRFLDHLPAMPPPLAEMGDGESDELRAAAAPRFFRVMSDEAWRRSRWTLAASVGAGCFVFGLLCGAEIVLVALLRGWMG